MEAACSACEKREQYVPSDWFAHCWHLYELQRSGYPFAANDLDVEEWLAIGQLREEMEAMKAGMTLGK